MTSRTDVPSSELAWRAEPYAIQHRFRTATRRRIAIIAGGGNLAQQLTKKIEQSPDLNITIAGIFDDRGNKRQPEALRRRQLGSLEELPAFAKKCQADIIYITLPMTSHPRILELIDELRDTTSSIYFVPDTLPFDPIQARPSSLAGIPLIAICETPHCGINGLLKRASDFVLASLMLLLLAPLMLCIAIAIKLSSAGPVIFKQRRYGLDGREIVVYKFRSMTVQDDGAEVRQATRNDSRLTPLGGFLRTSSLDELPQLINVLQGRMSLVGPRPHAVAHNEMYRKLINGYMLRHKVRPGITGWAQVNGLRGETESVDRMQARIEYDLAYLRNWTLWLDLKILFKTLLIVWKKENAY